MLYISRVKRVLFSFSRKYDHLPRLQRSKGQDTQVPDLLCRVDMKSPCVYAVRLAEVEPQESMSIESSPRGAMVVVIVVDAVVEGGCETGAEEEMAASRGARNRLVFRALVWLSS